MNYDFIRGKKATLKILLKNVYKTWENQLFSGQLRPD